MRTNKLTTRDHNFGESQPLELFSVRCIFAESQRQLFPHSDVFQSQRFRLATIDMENILFVCY
jgi:hypothetical protein